jgi:hypothetical protein
MSVSTEEIEKAGAKIDTFVFSALRTGLSAALCAWPFAFFKSEFALVAWALLFSGGRIVRAIERAASAPTSDASK